MSLRSSTQGVVQYLKRLDKRRWLLPLLAMGLTMIVIAGWPLIGNAADGISDRVLLYVHIARLYTKDPDQKLAMPLPAIQKKQIANTWHAARSGNRQHEGQDIFAPEGTPVYSSTSGYVYNIGENALGGQTVSIAGAGGRYYYYAHLSAYARGLSIGDRVTTRTVLGYVGTTGNAAGTPPHLHFGVYTSTGAINPLPLLADRQGAQTAIAPPHKRER